MNCRLCLIKCEDPVSIFADDESLLKLIFKYLHLKIQPDDRYSTNLCQNCTKNLQTFHNFYQHIQQCQSGLQPKQELSAKTSTLESVQRDLILKKRPVLEQSKTCRLCMEDCKHAVSIITEEDKNSCLQWIDKYLPLKLEADDLHSASMCLKCTKHLQEFHNCFQRVQDCQYTLKNMKVSEYEATDGLNALVKTEFLSTEEESDTCENDELLEDLEATNDLTEKSARLENEATCGIKFESKEMLDNHFKATECTQLQLMVPNTSDDKKRRTCGVCSKVYATIWKMKMHTHKRHNPKNQDIAKRTCSLCSKVYSTVFDLKDHMRFQHNGNKEGVEQRTCCECSKVFETSRKMKKHMYIQHNPKDKDPANRTCSLCCKLFDTIVKMHKHMRHLHNPKNKDITNRTCSVCSKVFSTIITLNKHMRLQHDEKNEDISNRTCSVCSKVCSTINNMKQHKRLQHKKKPDEAEHRTCGICAKVFDTIGKMKYHMRIQHSEKNEDVANRTCSVCFQVSSTTFGLDQHIRHRHNTKRGAIENRTCRMCFTVFDNKSQLNAHMSKEHKDSEETATRSGKQNAETVENKSKFSQMNCETSCTTEANWSADLRIKEEEPLEIDDFLEENNEKICLQ